MITKEMHGDLRRLGFVPAAAFAFTLVQACGSPHSSPGDTTSHAGAASGGTGGIVLNVAGATAHAGLGGTSNTSGGATGASGNAGVDAQAGSAGGAGGAGGAGVTSACTSTTAKLSGSWGSTPWQENYALQASFQTYGGASGALWQFHSTLDDDGFMLLRGQGANPKGDGTAHSATVMFETPSVGPTPGGWYCSTSGSALTDDQVETRVMLANLGRLGACGDGGDGVAVSGQISICADRTFPADCNFTRSGTLDGATVTTANLASGQGTYLDYIDLVFPDGMVIGYFRSNEFEPTGPDTNGFVILPDGTLYCAGPASARAESNGRTIDTLTGFKRLGTCANVTGPNTAQGCLGAPYKAGG